MRPKVAVTLGDPRGIGPEVVAEALRDPPPDTDFVVLGARRQLAPFDRYQTVAVDAQAALSDADPASVDAVTAGRVAGAALEHAARMALAGDVDALATGPVEKRALHEAGFHFPGQTEWLGSLAGVTDVAMMLVAGTLRVVLVTTHLPLREVPDTLTVDLVVRVGRTTVAGLRDWWRIPEPRIAVCALNPHAGEGGLFGDEEDRVLGPAARELGAAGPFSADTVFVRALRGEFDAVLSPTHDVGMTAVKVAGFGSGVNVTLGLPFIRTAPDHGTAFDIVGTGRASAGSMRAAIELASALVRQRD